MALDVMRHRLVLSYEALSDNVTGDELLKKILDRIPMPEVPLHEHCQRPPPRLSASSSGSTGRSSAGWMACCKATTAACSTATGVDFADLREYQPEDDIRYIDWNVTARMDTPYVRQYVEDREITAWFLLDLSPSMDFGTVQSLKRTVLIDFVATLARLLTRHGNRVGAMFYGGRVERTIPARGGRLQVLRLVNDLLKQPQLPQAPFTNLTPLLEAGLHAIKQRSLIFIISDFISAPGWERPLSLLNQRHEVLAIRLWDPREVELPDIGPIIMEDAETGEQLYVDTHDKKFRQRFQAAAQQREADAERGLQALRGGRAAALDRGRPGSRHRALCHAAAAATCVSERLKGGV